MSIVFEKTAAASAVGSGVNAVIAAIVGGVFAGILWRVEDLPLYVKVICVIAVLISVLMVLKITSEAITYLRRGEGWRVEITDETLSWSSPMPEFMESFLLPLSKIRGVRRELHIRKNSKAPSKHKFYIDLIDGSSLEIEYRLSAINPVKVFKALEQKGVTYTKDVIRTGANVRLKVS